MTYAPTIPHRTTRWQLTEAIALADTLLREAQANSTRRERRQLHRLGRLVADPAGRELVQRLTDEVLRIPSEPPRRRAGSPMSSPSTVCRRR